MFKLVQVDMKNPSKDNWKTLIAENPNHKLDWVAPVAGDKLIVAYLEDVKVLITSPLLFVRYIDYLFSLRYQSLCI